jgi:hypothetical protein
MTTTITSLKQAVAGHRTNTAKHFELRKQRDAAWSRAAELRGRIEKAQSAVEQAKADLGAAQNDYAVTGDFSPVDAAMKALAAAQSEHEVAVKTLTPMIERENEAARRIEMSPGMSEPRLPYREAAAHLLNTSADVRLFLYLYLESNLQFTDLAFRHGLGYEAGIHKAECKAAFQKLMDKA